MLWPKSCILKRLPFFSKVQYKHCIKKWLCISKKKSVPSRDRTLNINQSTIRSNRFSFSLNFHSITSYFNYLVELFLVTLQTFDYKTIKLQPLISLESNRPIISKLPSRFTRPRSCVAIKEHEFMFAKSMIFKPPVFPCS